MGVGKTASKFIDQPYDTITNEKGLKQLRTANRSKQPVRIVEGLLLHNGHSFAEVWQAEVAFPHTELSIAREVDPVPPPWQQSYRASITSRRYCTKQ